MSQNPPVSYPFVTKPFRVEKERCKKAEEQLKFLGNIFVKDLNELIERIPDKSLGFALDTVDRDIAGEIANRVMILKNKKKEKI